MNRALRAAAIGVLLIGPVALSACSAGQVNQTASQNRDKVGATARVGDITVRAIELAYPEDGNSYAPGSDAVLNGAIVNSGAANDTLVSITGDGFTGVAVTGTGAEATAPKATGAAPTAATTTAAGTSAATATTGATTTGATTTGATTTAALPTEAPSNDVGIKIPGNSAVFIGRDVPHVSLTGLTRSLTPAQTLRLTFTFQRAGAVTVDVVIANPGTPLPRTSSFNFEPTESVTPSAGSNG